MGTQIIKRDLGPFLIVSGPFVKLVLLQPAFGTYVSCISTLGVGFHTLYNSSCWQEFMLEGSKRRTHFIQEEDSHLMSHVLFTDHF